MEAKAVVWLRGFYLRWVLMVLGVVALSCSDERLGDESEGESGTVSQALCNEERLTVVSATASSVENSNKPASAAIDGSMSTRWSSQFSDPQWIKLDLGSSRYVSRVVLKWEAAASSDYEIQVSADGTTWNSIYVDHAGNGGTDDIKNLSGTGRYVRIYSTHRTTQYGVSLWEIEVYGSTNPNCAQPAGCAESQLSTSGTTASSVENNNSNLAASKATDGNLGTRWSSQFSDPQWLKIDLGSNRHISRVVLYWETAASKHYELQVSADGNTWQSIYNDNNGNGGTDDINGLSGVGRYLRVYSHTRTTSYGVSLWEVKVYGDTNPSCGVTACDHTYITTLANGDVEFKVTLPSGQQYVEVFVRQDGTQNVAQNIVSSGVSNGNGTTTYRYVKAASNFEAGDVLLTRFYSYKPSSPGVFTPGPAESVWAAPYVYGNPNCVTGTGDITGYCPAGSSTCCPVGYSPVVLTPAADTYQSATAKQCIVGLGGNDTIAAQGGDSVVIAGPGNDTFQAANGNNYVLPGAGADTVATGTGNDTVYIFNLCEIPAGGETIDTGTGTDTLVTPVPLSQLQSLGVNVSGVENVIVQQQNGCRSECTVKPDCSGHGQCNQEAGSSQLSCLCDRGWSGEHCDQRQVSMTDSPVSLTPTIGGGPDTTNVSVITPERPVSFEIPRDIWVKVGNAGNGILELTFRAPDVLGQPGPTTVCTYHGGSPVAAPTTDFDVAKGLRYRAPTCTNGYKYGDSAIGAYFEVEIVSDATNAAQTTVDLNLGQGCSGALPAALSPEEVVGMRDNFTWRTVAALPEIDPDGRAALWHGLIYIDQKRQLEALDRWRVFWSTMPLSETYLDTMAGKCGRVEHATDRKGVVVYAVFPAKLFNILRTFGIESELQNIEPPFKFIIPSTPDVAEFTNADGSISYQALADSRFDVWLADHPSQQPWFLEDVVNDVGDALSDAGDWIDENIIDPAGEVVDAGFSYAASGWDAAVDWVATAIDDTWEGIQVALGDIIAVFSPTITITIDTEMVNRDPAFPSGSRMIRAWGAAEPPSTSDPASVAPNGRRYIFPTGAYVSIRQWGWGFVPVMDRTAMGSNGRAVLDNVLEDAEGRGGNGLCVELDTDAAMMTTDFAPNEICDFDGPNFSDFEDSMHTVLRADQHELHALTQLVDSAAYVETVVGQPMHKMDVLIGGLSNTITSVVNGGESRAMCLCLDFPSISTAILGGVFGQYGTIIMKDLWWPDDKQSTIDSRGVATHEYGHFFMCSMAFDKEGGSDGTGPNALTPLIERVLEGQNDSRSDDLALVTESWADTFAMQVVGGSNYITSHGASGGRMGFCTPPGPVSTAVPPDPATPDTSYCMEWNFQGLGEHAPTDPFSDELALLESTIHDAFDRSDSSGRQTYQPWNGDVWHVQKDPFGNVVDNLGNVIPIQLTFSTVPYLAIEDEYATLSGVGWQWWMEHWLEQPNYPSRISYTTALSQAMRQQGVNWCDRCEVFANHASITDGGTPPRALNDPTAFLSSTFSNRVRKWEICRDNFAIMTTLDEAVPTPHLNLDPSCQACPPGSRWNADPMVLSCQACPTGHVPRGDRCDPCPNGTVPSGNECTSCGPYEITVGNTCQACPDGHGADRSLNICVPCPAQVLDWTTVPRACSEAWALTIPAGTLPDAICPGQMWFEIQNLDDTINLDLNRSGATFSASATPWPLPTSQTTCEVREGGVSLYVPGPFVDTWNPWTSANGRGTFTSPCTVPGCNECTYDFSRVSLGEAEMVSGWGNVRLKAYAADFSAGATLIGGALFMNMNYTNCVP